ncbi:anaerobic selenocysteine-containing dehydrogenase [Dongia mobilis]|uniref:Anaerobic selenocysteine-containing dehydrogenase n=1 Tax=Dongia mobilis TaxID=578943 RepID=A0A4R6WS00_9PROT|nr:molybdopterin oxidoreductase family protein [Dongia mobilis]TDQ81383.1 anaerobic selenocysteine-containing dehydrogenase [Dongia mobilis]
MTPFDTFHSACPHDCPSTCALEVERISPTQIGRIHGAKANSYTAGVICAKVARYAERQHHPDRLRQPLRRVGDKGVGRAGFEPISWSAALDEIARQFERAEQRFGAEAVFPYYYAGTMGLVQRDGIWRLTHEKKYSRMKSTICVTLADAGWQAGVGVMRGVDTREMAESDLIVVWGGNPVATQVNVMTHIARARKARGAKLVVVDPYRTGTAEAADLHLMLRPGSDAALAVAVMHVLFKEGLADRAYLARHTDVPEELERHVAGRSPEWAEEITGIPAATIRDFARLYGATKKSFIRVGYGFSRTRNGAVSLHAVSCLPSVTGAWAERGGGAHYSNRTIYHLDNSLIQGLDLLDPSVRELDQSRLGAILTGDRRDLGDGPPVTAMLVQSTNPMNVCPNSALVKKGFERDDLFVAVHEQFMTETAAMADIVLPATTFLEHDDIYRASGHTHLQVTRRIVEPLGEARPNHFVVTELAKRLGCRHRGFSLSEWEIIDETLRISDHVDAQTMYDNRWQDCALDFETTHFLNGFGHADGRFRFKPDWRAIGPDVEGLPALPDYVALIDRPTAEYPLRLVTAPARQFLNSTFTMTPTSRQREARPTVLIHPTDAARLGVADGVEVEIGNRLGSIRVHARLFDGLLPGTVVIESLWGNADFPGGLGVNALVSDEPGKPDGGAVFHDTAVWLRPHAAGAAA